jgi:hypothetical protein
VLQNAVRSLLVFFQDAMKEGWNLSQLKAKAMERGAEDAAANVFCEAWRAQYSSITSSILSRTLAANQLVDLEWKFGVTASTDDMASVGATFLQMKLVIDRGNGQVSCVCVGELRGHIAKLTCVAAQRENVYMEMTLDQFYSFMAQMEKAKAYMDFLSAES